MTRRPTCAAARPATCPCCAAAAQPVGGPFVIVGHGLLEREVRGPMCADGPPTTTQVVMRRYRCRACKAILVVGPRGVLRRRVYGAGAIAVALEAFGRGVSSAAVRTRTSPVKTIGVAARDRWVTLTRWIDAVRGGDLFHVRGLDGLTRRVAAADAALALAARGGRAIGTDIAAAAFAGAAIAA